MLNDPLANMLSKILNAGREGKPTCTIKPISGVIKNVLTMLHNHHYIGEFTEIEDGRGNIIMVNLLNRINKCGAIKPRYNVKNDGFEKFEKRYLPARDFGVIIISTPEGILTNTEAKEKRIGGKLLAYCY